MLNLTDAILVPQMFETIDTLINNMWKFLLLHIKPTLLLPDCIIFA